MGYTRRLAERALRHCNNSVQQAADYCILHADEDDDDELEMAIRMSLGETPPPPQTPEKAEEQKEIEDKLREAKRKRLQHFWKKIYVDSNSQ